MFEEYEETLIDFLNNLSCDDPDKFTKEDWKLVKFYTKSDGCTNASKSRVETCWEHDFYFRTHHDFTGKIISFSEANRRFRQSNQKRSGFGAFSPMAWWRWAAVSICGKSAWKGRKSCH